MFTFILHVQMIFKKTKYLTQFKRIYSREALFYLVNKYVLCIFSVGDGEDETNEYLLSVRSTAETFKYFIS